MLALFSARRPNAREVLKAAQTLFTRDIGLAAYPGPAAVLRDDGAVLIANRATAGIADLLGMGPGGSLHPTLAGAIRTGGCTTAAITLDATAGETLAGITYDFIVFPIVAGELALVIGRDTALESAFRGALTESRQRYKVLVDLCGDFCWETGADGRFSFVSPGGALDYGADELVGRHPAEFLDSTLADAADSPFLVETAVDAVDVWFRRADGRLACLETSSRPIMEGAAGRGMRGVCRDVTADRNRQAELSRIQIRERLIAHIMRTIRDEIEPGRVLEAAAQATAQAVGAQGCRVFREDGEGALVAAATFGSDAPADPVIAGMLARAREDGRTFAAQQGAHSLLCVATSYRRSGNGALVLWRAASDGGWTADESTLVNDVAVQLGVAIQQIRNQLELEALSRTDALTGLLNRRAFTAELEGRLARAGRSAAGSLFFVDLDNFKPVNDSLGHQKGDAALVAVARMLVDSTRPGDLVARLGGDEFALWLDRTDEEAASQRARDLVAGSRCLAPYSGDPARPLGISIGVAVYRPGSAENFDGLSARADAAMYQVKHNGKDGFVISPSTVESDVAPRTKVTA
jgi:diguanylate cyclase (GGDEF)-like protein/PAS domain S-box-containing protein